MAGGAKVASASRAERPAMESRIRPAVAGPMPSSICTTRKPVTRSAGFSAQRSTASRSLTCAASTNLSPPNLTKGMLRRVSSISSTALWCEVRNSTACSLRAVPSSRLRSTLSTTKLTWPMSSATVTSDGLASAVRSERKFLVKRSRARPITAFEAARIGCVER